MPAFSIQGVPRSDRNPSNDSCRGRLCKNKNKFARCEFISHYTLKNDQHCIKQPTSCLIKVLNRAQYPTDILLVVFLHGLGKKGPYSGFAAEVNKRGHNRQLTPEERSLISLDYPRQPMESYPQNLVRPCEAEVSTPINKETFTGELGWQKGRPSTQ